MDYRRTATIMLKKTLPYLIGYLLLLTAMVVLLATYSKGELHIMLNARHTGVGDVFFRYFTVLAEWPLYAMVLLLLFRRKMWWVAFYAASEGVSALIVTTLKHIFRMPRPLVFFGDDIASCVPVVEGVGLHHGLSFPSGHTATFFIFITATVILLAANTKNAHRTGFCGRSMTLVQVLLLVLAALGGYSRIYLSQHFLMDVCAGSLIGISVPYAVYRFFASRITNEATGLRTDSAAD